MQPDRKDGVQHHECRDVLALTKDLQARGQFWSKRSRSHTAFERARPRPLSIDREFSRSVDTAQLPDPVGSLDLTQAVRKPGALPLGIVRILHGQRGQSSRMPITAGVPQKGQFLPEDTE